jgi:hypothetical protein
MYFGSSQKLEELKNKVFLTPHMGIASIFIIDTGDMFPKDYACKCNIEYRQLSLFDTNDPDREVIYSGDEPLTIIRHIPHTIEWDLAFSQDDVKRYGIGTAEKI